MVVGSSSVSYYSSLLTSVESKAFSNIVPEGKSTWKNLTFPDAASTYNFYRSYATQVGFVFRKHWRSSKVPAKTKIDIPFYLHDSCNKRGFKKGSALDPSNDFDVDSIEGFEAKIFRKKAEVRIGCYADIRFQLSDDRSYRITSWNDENFHPLHLKEHSHLLHPKINHIQAVVVVVNAEAGIRNRSSFELFSRIGGIEKVGLGPLI
ncbi:hypothetical protein LIER_19571 [Lithospermum erythrorhizon]|uniref:FAR1 domain-containing protein n=1 Tax=Lithospermum erythrorhizon TaxID=34254 RepID=A0AAV3QMJ9_LITER